MERYLAYKPSGVEWIGEIPEHWKIKRIGQLFYNRSETVSDTFFQPLSVSKNGIVPQLDGVAKTDNNDGRKLVKKGDFVINSRSDRKGSSGFSNLDGSVSVINIVLEPKEISSKFAHHLFRSYDFIEEFFRNGKGIVMDLWSTRYSEMKYINIPYPPLQEQHQIVEFLDEKTGLIDKLISIKERKIALLKEQRTALINQVVTKGLDPNVKMKESGVEWIGEIPEHWQIGKLKHNSIINISSVDKHIYEDEIIVRVCNYTDVYYNEFISKSLELNYGSCTSLELGKFRLEIGDVIITKDSETPNDIGVPSFVIDELENVVCGYHLTIIKSNINSLRGGYLFRQLQTTRVRRYFEVNSNGITRFGLGKASVLELTIILPPILDQHQIVEYLDTHTKEIDDLVSMEQRKIDLLKEYRQSLISEVVTGKIKVTNY